MTDVPQVFTADSPRPKLEVLVGNINDRPCVDIATLFWYFLDSANWNSVATEGDPDKVAGLDAATTAMSELIKDARTALNLKENPNDHD